MDYDYAIIGSGFGGSVSGLRLAEKGYRVVMLEKGRRFKAEDFPKSNWNLPRWLWLPAAGFRGIFKMTFLRHVTVVSGVGVGGGSLVYANTLPIPRDDFFAAPSWSGLADWKRELAPHYPTVHRMLGATQNPYTTPADEVVRQIGRDLGRPESDFRRTPVAVYFGKPDVTVPDPYFGGEGPERTGCIQCGGCMIGCRHGAKNTLDKNYLWLAEKRGLTIEADTEATWVRELGSAEGGAQGGASSVSAASGEHGYQVDALQGASHFGRKRRSWTARNVIFSGGVLGTVPLLLKLRASKDGLPRLSPRVGEFVRTNSEALIGVTSRDTTVDHSQGIAIGSVLHTDEHSHLEPVRYPAGSGFFRLMVAPHAPGKRALWRVLRALGECVRHPRRLFGALFAGDWARRTIVLLYMRTMEGYLKMRLGIGGLLTTSIARGSAPTASIPEATDLARRVAEKVDGLPQGLATELLLDTPTTAHILGGACMGRSAEEGVIDHRHRVFGYEGLSVIDGAAISANPGVNPSLTIAALAERAMALVPEKSALTGPGTRS
jgi:cholesterol oxidase